MEQAWSRWREARDLTGETPELAQVAENLRQIEGGRQREKDYRRILALIDTGPEDPERLARMREAAETAEAWLERWASTPRAEEMRAAGEYAAGEVRVLETYAAAIQEARAALAGEKWKECAEACSRALEVQDRPEAHELRDRALRRLTPEGMVFIPGGLFKAGKDGTPVHLPPFYVDRTEVTNAQYAAFVAATGHPAPDRFVEGEPVPGEEKRPATWVTLDDALAYAAWAGKRLPTELEWERAARGTDGRLYPWGNEWDPGKGHFGSGGTVDAGSKPLDRSPDGVLDLAGNVMEMTIPLSDPKAEREGPVMKGGHWSDDFHPEYALTFARYAVDRDHKGSGSGFRCVKPAAR
jgi:formylglycine-generating enzyme required for sulfatase activity